MPGHVDILIDYYFTLQLATTVKTGQNQQHRQAQSQLKKGLLDKVNPGLKIWLSHRTKRLILCEKSMQLLHQYAITSPRRWQNIILVSYMLLLTGNCRS